MTTAHSRWQLDTRVERSLPALAWVARVSAGCVDVAVGESVQRTADSFFEGTWAGAPEVDSLHERTTLFGSGMTVGSDGSLRVLTPSHQLEGVYSARSGDELVVSNSLVGTLTAANIELDSNVDYAAIFAAGHDLWRLVEEDGPAGSTRLVGSSLSVPTLSEPVSFRRFENLTIAPDLTVLEERKPREAPFTSFGEYRQRLIEAAATVIANAGDHSRRVSLAAGYDSTAVAAVAAQAGGHNAVGFLTARSSPRDGTVADSGSPTAAVLGMNFDAFDRLAYMNDHEKPEAEFLATGHAGEEIIFSGLAQTLRHRTLLNGYWAGTQWAMSHRDDWRHVWPSTSAGASITEFRLRNDFYYVPLPCFAAVGRPDSASLLDQPDMAPYRVGGRYDRPIPRRLAEEAGIPRGTFGVTKHAANVVLPVEGLAAFTAETRESLSAFAAAEGRSAEPQRRRRFGKLDRGLVRLADMTGARGTADRMRDRQRSLVRFDPEFGNLVLRWAVSELAPRYAAVARVERCRHRSRRGASSSTSPLPCRPLPGWRTSTSWSSTCAVARRYASASRASSTARGQGRRASSPSPGRRRRSVRASWWMVGSW